MTQVEAVDHQPRRGRGGDQPHAGCERAARPGAHSTAWANGVCAVWCGCTADCGAAVRGYTVYFYESFFMCSYKIFVQFVFLQFFLFEC